MATDTRTKPDIGEVFIDARDRALTVTKVELDNREGRQVQGYLGGNHGHRYACTIVEWERTWRDRVSSPDRDDYTGMTK